VLLARRATTRDDAVLDISPGEVLERAGGELLLARLRAMAGELVQDAGLLRRHEDGEVLVGRVTGDVRGCEDLHGNLGCETGDDRLRGDRHRAL